MDGAKLRQRLAGLDALYERATTPGEADAAQRGRERVRAHLAQLDASEGETEAPPPGGATTSLWWQRDPSTWNEAEVGACAELIALLTLELEVLGL